MRRKEVFPELAHQSVILPAMPWNNLTSMDKELATRFTHTGMMFGLAHVQAAEDRVPRDRDLVGFGQRPLLARRGRPTWTPPPAATPASRLQRSGQVSISGRWCPPAPVTTPPDHQRQGDSVMPGRVACNPSPGLIKKVTGACILRHAHTSPPVAKAKEAGGSCPSLDDGWEPFGVLLARRCR